MRLWLLLFIPSFSFALSYQVHFVGIENNLPLIRALQDSSQLVSLQYRPPASMNGLRYRTNADIPLLIKTLHAFGYYDSQITTLIQKNKELDVYLFIETGPQYTLSSYEIYNGDCTTFQPIESCLPFKPEQLGLELGAPIESIQIINAELRLLTELSKCGRPLAWIRKRRVEVDMIEKKVLAAACVEEGPLSKFGPVSFFGLGYTKPQFAQSKIGWTEGDIYNFEEIRATEERLLKSELFSSVYISHESELDEEGMLPIKIRFTEAKYKQINLGIFYATVDGVGGSFSWSHKNVRGMGETISLKGDFSARYLAGNLTYKKPDFLRFDQTLKLFGEISQLNIRAYDAFIYRGVSLIERKVGDQAYFSVGMKVEHLNISKSATNQTYLLFGVPIFANYLYVDNILNASRGCTLMYSATPYQSLFYGNQQFIKQRFTSTFYLPLGLKEKFTLAFRMQFGSVAGTSRKNVPLSKLFLGGSEDDLRGYRYKTVSPLNANDQPLGGRSAIFTTIEPRLRLTKSIGLVSFFDCGTVSEKQVPDFSTKWFTSVGAGIRYFAFFGPFRLDVGFPLNKRKGIDPNFQIYASIGQAF